MPAVLEAGLPNITGTVNGVDSSVDGTRGDGAFASGSIALLMTKGSAIGVNKYTFDAKRSSSIYSNSDTVQPPALCLIPQIKF